MILPLALGQMLSYHKKVCFPDPDVVFSMPRLLSKRSNIYVLTLKKNKKRQWYFQGSLVPGSPCSTWHPDERGIEFLETTYGEVYVGLKVIRDDIFTMIERGFMIGVKGNEPGVIQETFWPEKKGFGDTQIPQTDSGEPQYKSFWQQLVGWLQKLFNKNG